MIFEINTTTEPTHVCISVKGELNGATAPQLEANLAGFLTHPGKQWVLDLEKLVFSSSAGLRVFLSYAKKTKNVGGRLIFCAVQPGVMDVFEVSGFTRIFTIVPTLDQARKLAGAS